MNRQRLRIGAVLVFIVLLAGCSGVQYDGADITVYDPTTTVDVEGETASWTWSGTITLDSDTGPCDIKATATLYDKNGTIVGEKVKVLKNVGEENTREITFIGSAEQVGQISNYDLEFEEPDC